MSVLLRSPLGTKAMVPRQPQPWHRRPRLNDRLMSLQPGEVALLAAPAGWGKTSLLADWFLNDRHGVSAWLTLDARDNEPGRLGELIARALCENGGASVMPEADSVAIDRAFEFLVTRGEETVLVLDEVQELTARHALDALGHLLLRMPQVLSIAIATRADPPIGLARLHLEGRLQQLRMHELACTADEAADLFAAHGVHLSRSASDALWSRMEGWIAGIRLAALALAAEKDHDRFVADTLHTEEVVSDYLLQEVLGRLPPDQQEFLLRTSIAEPLTADLAEVLTGCETAQERLEELEHNGVFVTRIDDDPSTYRFHALFGALLRARLRCESPELTEQLLDQAARWFAGHDMPLEAESHAQAAGDWELAGQLACDRWTRDALRSPEFPPPPSVEAPVEVSERVAPVALLLAATAIRSGDRAAANRWRGRVDSVDSVGAGELEMSRPLVDVLFGRAFGSDTRSLRAASVLSASKHAAADPIAHAVVRLREAELLLDSAEPDTALDALFHARWLARRDAPRVVEACDALLALVSALSGRLRAADRFLESVGIELRVAEDTSASFARRLARVLSDMARGRVISARTSLLEAVPPSEIPHAVRTVYDALLDHVVMGGTARRDGAFHARSLAARVQVAIGAIDDVEHVSSAPPGEVLLARARRAHAAGHHEQVAEVLAPFADGIGDDVHLRTRIEACALLAIAADHVDDGGTATAALRRACELAAPGDVRSPLLAHAVELAPVLERYAWQLAPDSAYAIELVDVLQPTDVPVYVEPLTERERAVLEYLPTMMSNSEIALQLRVSVNTVKTHLKSVYRKLGVDRRRDAVLRGRQLEII
jgi:LuxR family maltose regulon positive regulatory protein